MIIDVVALLEFLGIVAEMKEALDEFLALFEGEEPPSTVEYTREQRIEALKKATLFIRRLDLDINCYPLGYTTTQLFDMDGNPIP